MASSVPIQATTLSRLAAVNPDAFQSASSATAASAASLLNASSSIVQLSGLGQALAAASTLESRLEALQANTAGATAGSVFTEAQAFVVAFNSVAQSIAKLATAQGTTPDNALIAEFSQTLDAAATTNAGGQGLSSLQAIGITFIAASPTGSGADTARLSIDQSALTAAAEANPQGTAALLAQASQPLLQQVVAFEVQATTGPPGESSVPGTTVPTQLLQQLSADTALNNITLADLDLAAVGLDASTIESSGAALAGSLSAALAGPAGTNIALSEPAAPLATPPAAPGAAPLASVTSPTTGVASAQPAAASTPVAAAAIPVTAPPAAANTETPAADQGAADATLALRNQLADSALRSVIFDPAYSALMASSHLIDFTTPQPAIRADAIPADVPGAVLAINRSRAISNYQEAANGFVRR